MLRLGRECRARLPPARGSPVLVVQPTRQDLARTYRAELCTVTLAALHLRGAVAFGPNRHSAVVVQSSGHAASATPKALQNPAAPVRRNPSSGVHTPFPPRRRFVGDARRTRAKVRFRIRWYLATARAARPTSQKRGLPWRCHRPRSGSRVGSCRNCGFHSERPKSCIHHAAIQTKSHFTLPAK